MKIISYLLMVLSTLHVAAQPIDRTFENGQGTLNLLGISSASRLTEAPFDVWYQEHYDAYEVNTEALREVQWSDSITLFMGTWCGDSKREVPRFVKMLEAANYDLSRFKIINLNTGFQNYKQAPEREESGQFIHRVPTFVFQRADGTEIGRIVQDPLVSLEEDTRTILQGEPYKTAFPIAEQMIEHFKSTDLRDLRRRLPQLASAYLDQSAGEGELRTFGYVMWTSFQLEEADLLFELNTLLYPTSVEARLLLIRFKDFYGRQREAKTLVRKALKLDPQNADLLEWKELLKES